MKTIMILCVFAATPMYALAIKEPTVLPDAMEGVALEQVTCEAVGGTPPLVWSLKDAPSGIEIIDGGGFGDTDFKVGGVPHMGTGHKDGQVYVVTIVVTDKSPPGGQKAEITLPMTVYAAVRLTSPSDLGVVETGETFSFTLGTAGGYTTTNGGLSFSSPDLPSWLNLNPDTGKLSGIPDTGGTYEFEVTVQDEWSTPTSDTEQYVIQVEFSDVIILTSNLPTATAGEFYSQSLVATG
ncbi:MAG: putative Ig domain-containing protein, partial [Planctomycetes bacterium]|nr:putative Ig domain-containing protein [Planctomycetota bacterium]